MLFLTALEPLTPINRNGNDASDNNVLDPTDALMVVSVVESFLERSTSILTLTIYINSLDLSVW